MSDSSYSEKTKGEDKTQNYESNNSHKEYGGNSNYRSSKRYYEHGKQKTQTNDGYYENKGRDYRRNYDYDDDEQTTQDSEHYYKKNYTNGGNSKYEGNYNKQYNANSKGPRRPHNYQQANVWKKKKENFSKTSKEIIIEKFTDVGEPDTAFAVIMELNPQLFSKKAQRPVAEEKFELDPDEGVTERPVVTGPRETKELIEEKGERGHEAFHTAHKPTNWDDGGDGNYFNEIDMNKMDALLRGGKPKDWNEARKGHANEEEKDTYHEEIEHQEKDPWDINEDNGEFSNIDEIFEKKLKEKKLQFSDEDEEEEVDFGLLKKAPAIEEEEGEAPVWEGFDAAAIKKETKDVENLLLGWKSDPENLREINGFIGHPDKQASLENDSFDKKTQSIQRNDEIFHNKYPTHPTAIRIPTEKASPAKHPQLIQQPGMQPSISLQQHVPLQQQQILMQQHIYSPHMFYNQDQNTNFMQGKNQATQLPIGLQPPLQAIIPNAFTHFTSYGFKPDVWYYLDRQKIRQGPFTAKQMNEWYMGNHLPMDLPITSGENVNFMALRDLIDLIFKPSGYNSNPVRSPTTGQPIYQQVQSPVQIMPQQQDMNANKATQFQFSQLLDDPLFQNLTEKPSNSTPTNTKTTEELEQQGPQENYGQYGGYNQPKQTRKQSGGNFHEHSKKSHQQQGHNVMNQQILPPEQMYSPIGMLQPGFAIPQELGNPGHLSQGNQAKKKNTGKTKQDKGTKEKGGKTSLQNFEQAQPQSAVDMTNSLKSMLGIGISVSDSGIESLARNQSKKKANVPMFDSADFPSLSDSNK